jgi:hypothetical protein
LTGVWVWSESEALAVGDAGTVLRFDGERWNDEDAGTVETLLSVRGYAARGAYACGTAGTVLRRTRAGWESMDVPTGAFLSDVWGTAGFVAVVGDGGTAWVRRASAWEATPTPVDGLLLALFGRAPADLYACGRDGAIIHFDGDRWESVESPTQLTLGAVWGGLKRVTFAGHYGSIVRLDRFPAN